MPVRVLQWYGVPSTAVPYLDGALDLRLVLLRLPHRPHHGPSRGQCAEQEVDVEGVEAPPDERGGEEAGRDGAAECRAKGHLDGTAATRGGDDRGAVEEAERPEGERGERRRRHTREHQRGEHGEPDADVHHRGEEGE